MIHITKGQALKDNPGIVVYSPTGYYDDGAPVLCASIEDPESPVCRYEAKFVFYGNMVYSIGDEDLLLKEILKVDPNSLFGKSNQEVAVDAAVEEIETVSTQEQTPALDASTTDSSSTNSENSESSDVASSTPATSNQDSAATTPNTVENATTTQTSVGASESGGQSSDTLISTPVENATTTPGIDSQSLENTTSTGSGDGANSLEGDLFTNIEEAASPQHASSTTFSSVPEPSATSTVDNPTNNSELIDVVDESVTPLNPSEDQNFESMVIPSQSEATTSTPMSSLKRRSRTATKPVKRKIAIRKKARKIS